MTPHTLKLAHRIKSYSQNIEMLWPPNLIDGSLQIQFRQKGGSFFDLQKSYELKNLGTIFLRASRISLVRGELLSLKPSKVIRVTPNVGKHRQKIFLYFPPKFSRFTSFYFAAFMLISRFTSFYFAAFMLFSVILLHFYNQG